jgi:hypothetical protein
MKAVNPQGLAAFGFSVHSTLSILFKQKIKCMIASKDKLIVFLVSDRK